MTWIAGANGNGSADNFTFSNIPQTFTHLQIRATMRTIRAFTEEQVYVAYNGAGGTSYAAHRLYGFNGTATYSEANTSTNVQYIGLCAAANSLANVLATYVIDIYDYSNTSKNKTLRSINGMDFNGNSASYVYLSSGLWMSTDAITQVVLRSNGGLTTTSRADLYGITVSSQTGE